MSETVNVSDEGQRDPVPSDWRGDGAEYLTVPLSEEASERLCSATYFTDEWLKGHEDDEECVLPVNHVQTLLTLADAVVIRSGKAMAAARENSPVPAPARETTSSRCPRCGKLNVDIHTCSASPWAAEYERIKPALDALADSVKGCGKLYKGDICYPDDLCRSCELKRDAAITTLTNPSP